MSYTATVFKVMIASPGDVSAERAVIRERLSEWNIVNSDSRKIVLLPIGWETHSNPAMGERPQEIINSQLLYDCDLLVGVFWTRIGTSTGQYESGTVEEIEEHIKLGKPAMLYFSSAPVVLDSVDAEQYSKLRAFKESCKSRGLYESYTDLGEFKEKFYRQLLLLVNRDAYFKTNDDSSAVDSQVIDSSASLPSLKREAQVLLKEASLDERGQIFRMKHATGLVIQANNKNFVDDKDPRSVAKWESAIEELETYGLIYNDGSKRQLFKLTGKGYELADQLDP